MTGVILGMPGPWAKDNREASDHYTTKIGGLPDWPVPELYIRPDLLKCGACGSSLCLVAQVYAPLSSTRKIKERILYIFGCVMPDCGSSPSSWRAIRIQKLYDGDESNPTSQELAPLAAPSGLNSTTDNLWDEDLWTNGAGEEDDDLDLEELSRALSKAASVASHSKKQNGNRHSKSVMNYSSTGPSTTVVDTNTPVVPCFYIYSQEEPSTRDVNAICSKYSSLSIKEKQTDLHDHREDETWEEEGYEYDRALNADRTYLKFKKRSEAYPEQCFRYSYGGNPLLATNELVDPRNCGICGESRHFEMQLMPQLLFFLQQASDALSTHSLEDWNWMTLLLYTCSKSCSCSLNQPMSNNDEWTVVEEFIILQLEETLNGPAQIGYLS